LPLRIPDAAPNVPAAGDIDLFGGNRARDLQVAGQNLGQASDTLFALYERHAQQANDTRVQDFNNQFITGMQQILRTGPEAYFNQKGADAIRGAGAVTERLAKLKEEVIGQAPNDYQRRKLAPILDAHFASGSEQIARHVDQQQQVYERNVHLASIEVAKQEAISNPGNLAAAVTRAADATRALYKGQAPEVAEVEARKAASRIVSSLIKDRLVRNDRAAVGLYRQYERRLDPQDRTALGMAVETLSNQVDAAAWVHDSGANLSLRKDRTPMATGDAALDAVNAASPASSEPALATSSASPLLDQEGVAGYRQRLDRIEDRRRALTALNEQEFAANPARLRANRMAIEADSAQGTRGGVCRCERALRRAAPPPDGGRPEWRPRRDPASSNDHEPAHRAAAGSGGRPGPRRHRRPQVEHRPADLVRDPPGADRQRRQRAAALGIEEPRPVHGQAV
jgi:hypothetical protein